MIPRLLRSRIASNRAIPKCKPIQIRSSWLLRPTLTPFQVEGGQRFSSQASTGSVRAALPTTSPVNTESDLSQWERLADITISSNPRMCVNGKKRDDDTEALTNLCQKQINYWHKIYPLTDEQISGVKQIAKLAILYRNVRSSSFREILQKAKCFNPKLLYLAAQRMFRPIIPEPFEIVEDRDVIDISLLIRLRLFYMGLLAGDTFSALCLWSPYDTPEQRQVEEMIVRCLDNEDVNSLAQEFVILVQAVKADIAGNEDEARKYYNQFEPKHFVEMEFIWKRCVQYLFAVDEEKALEAILCGIPLIPPIMIANTLEELLDFTDDEKMKMRLSIRLHEFLPNKYTYNSIAESYARKGDILMAREYHELAGAIGDKESQKWMEGYLEKMYKLSTFKKKSHYNELHSWRRLIAAGDERLDSENSK